MSISWKHQLSICTNKLDLKTLIVPEFMANINIGKKRIITLIYYTSTQVSRGLLLVITDKVIRYYRKV